MKVNFLKKQSGFSLIEIIVVIFIVNVGLLSIISLTMQVIQVSRINRNVLVASQLAQEGIELVRNTRDTSWLDGVTAWPWSDGVYTVAYDTNDFVENLVVYSGSTTTDIAVGLNDPRSILFLDANGFYGHGVGTSTKFKRVINVFSPDASSTEVTSVIRISDSGTAKDYIVNTMLYAWR